MNRLTRIVLALIATFGLLQCRDKDKSNTIEEHDKAENPYLISYAGGYTIEIKGQGNTGDIELYVLANNGKAQWMLLKTAGRQEPEVMITKYGTWTAKDSYIKISIDGNTSQLIEEYEMKNGIFHDKGAPERYLKRTVN